MTLKAVLENLDDVPEALKSEYKEKDGKFYLDIDDTIKVHTAVLPLANTLNAQKTKIASLTTENTALKAKTTGLPEDFSPEKFEELNTELELLKSEGGADGKKAQERLQQARDQYESRIQALEAKRVADLAAKESEISELNGSIHKLVVEDGLTKSLVSVGVGKEYLKATNSLLKPSVKVTKDENGNYQPVVESDMGDMPLDQFVENWSKSDEGKVFVKPASGGGSGGSGDRSGRGEANPWSKDSWNLTQQGEILKSDKAKAERLMKAANVAPATIRSTIGA